MDVPVSHDLSPHPQRPEQGALVPVSFPIVVGCDCPGASEPDLLAVLWRCFCRLAWLFFLALVLLRRLRRQVVELCWQVNYWQGQHRRAVQREGELAAQVHNLQGEIRELKRRLFGRKSESSSQAPPNTQVSPNRNDNRRRSRGQQRGSKGHGRRHHDHLPTTHEDCDLADEQKCCPACGEAYEEIPGTADGDILEIHVRAHRRRYHRKRFRRVCACPGQPALITAPPPDKLIPKSNIGLSLWVMILQRKFEFFQPLHRILAELRSRDLRLCAGTITGGLQQLVPLFQPLYELVVDHNRGEKHWHCDETRWLVFVHYQAKANFTWYLWVFAAKESIVFVLDPTRAHDVPENHFGNDAEGVANVDRYSGYKAMAQAKAGRILLAFCWAHVRRDFLAVLTAWPELTAWAWSWVEAIGLLYQRNDQRLTTTEAPTAHAEAERLLREHVEHMRQRCDTELALPDLRLPQRKALASLYEHWPGLTLFVDHPHLPLDNNEAERRLRGPVVARKNFYGSAALWSGSLAAMLFSLFQTIHIWGMDVAKWLTRYLSACANARGKPPPDPQRFLPWNMTPQERERLSQTKAPPPDPEQPPAE